MNRKSLVNISSVLLTVLTSLSAQAYEVGGVKVSGEAVFDYNFLSSGGNSYPAAGGAPNEQYRLAQAQIVLTKDTEDFNFLGRLSYVPTDYLTGPTNAPVAGKNNIGTLDQLEVYYKARPDLQIGFGRFLTTMGVESLLHFENTLFQNTVAYQAIIPGYGEGLRLKYTPHELFGLNVSTYNRAAYNQFGDDYTPTKTTEVSFSGTWKSLYWFGAHYFGTDINATTTAKVDKTASSALLTYKWTDSFTTSLTYDTRSQKSNGAAEVRATSSALHAAYRWEKHLFGLRYENIKGLSDIEPLNGNPGTFYATGDKLDVITIGDKFSVTENIDLHVEYRMDKADKDAFKKNDGTATDSANIWTLGAIAHF